MALVPNFNDIFPKCAYLTNYQTNDCNLMPPGTVCLLWTKLLFLYCSPPENITRPKAKSPWCHDSNAPSFVINGPTVGGAREYWSGQKNGVLGRIIVIFAEIDNFWNSIYIFLRLLKSFLAEKFIPQKFSSVPTGMKRSGYVGPSRVFKKTYC